MIIRKNTIIMKSNHPTAESKIIKNGEPSLNDTQSNTDRMDMSVISTDYVAIVSLAKWRY